MTTFGRFVGTAESSQVRRDSPMSASRIMGIEIFDDLINYPVAHHHQGAQT